MESIASLRPVFQARPFHLSHYDDELCYFVEELSRESDCLLIGGSENGSENGSGNDKPSNDFFSVADGHDKVYLRVFYYRPDQKYYASLTYAPWPAFADDPLIAMKGHDTVRGALDQVFRVYSYYRHETRKPVPFLQDYTDYRMTGEAIRLVEQKMLL